MVAEEAVLVPTSDAPADDETKAKAEKVPPPSMAILHPHRPSLTCTPLSPSHSHCTLQFLTIESHSPPLRCLRTQRAMWISIASLLFSIPALIGA